MTKKRLRRFLIALIGLAIVLGLISGRISDMEARRIYLQTLVILYALVLVAWILLLIRWKVRPQVRGLIENHLKPEENPTTLPDELNILIKVVRKARRRAYQFESSLKPRFNRIFQEGSDSEKEPKTSQRSRRIKLTERLRSGPTFKEIRYLL